MDDVEPELSRRDRIAVRDGYVLMDRRDPVRDDLRAGAVLYVLVSGDVIRVAVRVEDVPDLHAPCVDRLENRVDPEGRVDDHSFSAGFLGHQVGEVEVRPDAELVEKHGSTRRERYLT